MILRIKIWLELNVSFDQTNRYNANIIPCYRRYWIGDFPLVFDSFNAIPKVWLAPNISTVHVYNPKITRSAILDGRTFYFGNCLDYDSILSAVNMQSLEHRRYYQSLVLLFQCIKGNGPDLFFWFIRTSYIALQFKEQRSQSHSTIL